MPILVLGRMLRPGKGMTRVIRVGVDQVFPPSVDFESTAYARSSLPQGPVPTPSQYIQVRYTVPSLPIVVLVYWSAFGEICGGATATACQVAPPSLECDT